MKKIFTCFFVLLFSNMLFAKKVDLEMAKRVGINFYYERIRQYSNIEYKDLHSAGYFTIAVGGIPVYYAINMEKNGWVVVSADDAVIPVLAYSFDGSFTNENQPPQFIAWMRGYAQQIEYALTNKVTAGPSVLLAWERLSATDPVALDNRVYRDVIPMLQSTWDQGNPYNKLCPEDVAGPGGHVWAGCVATAMCQVMYYYRWPNTGNGQNCYTPSGYDEQCANFGATTYNWEEMMNAHNNSIYNDTAMATLLWHAGISVNMMYSPNGSGAFSEDAAAAMINNFRYSPNTQLLYKEDYPDEDTWATILRDNLDNKRPLYYHGFGTGGHAFNVDGYQGTDYFHFNWGWSGSYNGYYYLNNLNPGGNNFTEGQGAIVNLYPDTLTNNYPENCSGQMTLDALAGTIDDGSGPSKQYQPNVNCSWLIDPTTISDSILSITVSFNKFNTEAGNDILRIYQGETTGDELLAEYSGENIPPPVTVNNNKALITFTTNGNVEKEGWFITYVTTSMTWCSGMTTLTEPSGTISDGSFDFNYKNKSNCRWKIVPENAGGVMLTFTSFNTEQDNDILKIYDLGSEQLIAEISGNYTEGNLPGPITAGNEGMYLIFTSNPTITDQGWEGYYSTFPVGFHETGELSSIRIFPNPAADYINIIAKKLKSPVIHYELLSIDGRSISKKSMTAEKGTIQPKISLVGLQQGLYVLKLFSNDDVTLKKVVIR